MNGEILQNLQHERQFDECHRLYKRCNKGNARCSSKCYSDNRDKELEDTKTYYHNNREKVFDLEKNRRNIQKSDIYEFSIKFQNLTRVIKH